MVAVENIAVLACALSMRSSNVAPVHIDLNALVSRWSGIEDHDLIVAIGDAISAINQPDADKVVEDHIDAVARQLAHTDRERLLAELINFALKDDLLDSTESKLINQIARGWDMHPPVLDESSRRHWSLLNPSGRSDWSPIHDLALVYIGLAHRADRDLVPDEIEAIKLKIAEWLPASIPSDVTTIVRKALGRYSENLDSAILQTAVDSVRDAIPVHQRAALLRDLMFVAEADGVILVEERAIIDNLASAWNINKT